jgi:hypothetical protein
VKIERIVPILTVSDLARAIREHTDVLGLEVVMDMDWVASSPTALAASSA